MDTNTNTNTEIVDSKLQEEITKDVIAELQAVGIRVVPNRFEPMKKAYELVKKYQQLEVNHTKEVERIQSRYSNQVASEKLAVLNVDHGYDVQGLIEDLKTIEQEDISYKHKHYESLQKVSTYKEAKSQALEIVNMLKGVKGVPSEYILEILEPVIEVADTKTLELCKYLTGANTEIGRHIDLKLQQVSRALNTSEISPYLSSIEHFFRTNDADVLMFQFMSLYE